MAVPTSNISMTNLNTVFAKGFSLSGYYGTTFTSGSAPASGTISYSMFSGKSAAPSVSASVQPTSVSGSDRTFYIFTTNGTFTIGSGTKSVEIMAIGGGGGGGSYSGGGGGAGNMIVATGTLSAAIYTIVIGAGGVGGVYNNEGNSTAGGNGGSSIFSSPSTALLTALGGGGGGGATGGEPRGGQNGGCGGGGSCDGNSAGGSPYIVGGTPVQGTVFSPLTATSNLATYGGTGVDELAVGGAGGGGTSGAGVSQTNPVSAGQNGGPGTLYYGTYYGGGGGGAQSTDEYNGSPYTAGAGGIGGGGTGSSYGDGAGSVNGLFRGTAGAPNTGGGGGGVGGEGRGVSFDEPGLSGGTGIVIVSYAN